MPPQQIDWSKVGGLTPEERRDLLTRPMEPMGGTTSRNQSEPWNAEDSMSVARIALPLLSIIPGTSWPALAARGIGGLASIGFGAQGVKEALDQDDPDYISAALNAVLGVGFGAQGLRTATPAWRRAAILKRAEEAAKRTAESVIEASNTAQAAKAAEVAAAATGLPKAGGGGAAAATTRGARGKAGTPTRPKPTNPLAAGFESSAVWPPKGGAAQTPVAATAAQRAIAAAEAMARLRRSLSGVRPPLVTPTPPVPITPERIRDLSGILPRQRAPIAPASTPEAIAEDLMARAAARQAAQATGPTVPAAPPGVAVPPAAPPGVTSPVTPPPGLPRAGGAPPAAAPAPPVLPTPGGAPAVPAGVAPVAAAPAVGGVVDEALAAEQAAAVAIRRAAQTAKAREARAANRAKAKLAAPTSPAGGPVVPEPPAAGPAQIVTIMVKGKPVKLQFESDIERLAYTYAEQLAGGSNSKIADALRTHLINATQLDGVAVNQLGQQMRARVRMLGTAAAKSLKRDPNAVIPVPKLPTTPVAAAPTPPVPVTQPAVPGSPAAPTGTTVPGLPLASGAPGVTPPPGLPMAGGKPAPRLVKKPGAVPAAAPAAPAVTSPVTRPAFMEGFETPIFKRGKDSFRFVFDNPVDEAAYNLGSGGVRRLPQDPDLLKFVMDSTGLDEFTARTYGTQVRERLKAMTAEKGAGMGKEFVRRMPIPAMPELLEEAKAVQAARAAGTGKTAAQRSADAQGEKAQRLQREGMAGALAEDVTQLPPLVTNFISSVRMVGRLVKSKDAVPDTMRAQITEAAQILAELAPRLPEGADKTMVLKALKDAVTTVGKAEKQVPASTAGLLKALEQATAKAEKIRKAKVATPEGHAIVDTARALAGKIGADAAGIDKLEETIDKAVAAATPAQKADLKEASRAITELIARLGKDTSGAETIESALIGTGIAGSGLAGYMAGQSMRPEESGYNRETWGAAGAASGLLLALAGSSVALTPGKLAKIEKLIDWNRFSLLSSPNAMRNANMGSMAAVFTKFTEAMLDKNYKGAAAGMKELARQMKDRVWFKAAFGNPGDYINDPALRAEFARTGGKSALKPGAKGITTFPARLIAAGDVVSTNAIMKMGYSRQDALSANLGGEAKTWPGRFVMRALNEPVRYTVKGPLGGEIEKVHQPWLDPKEHPWAQLGLRFVSPFTRTAVNTLEQGISYSPLGIPFRNTFGLTQNQANARAVMGIGAAGAGMAQARNTSSDVDPLALAAAGPMALPMFAGQRIMRGLDRDAPLQTIAQQLWEEVPMIGEQFGLQDMPGRVVPAGLREIARAIDPAFEREKGPAQVVQEMRRQGGPVNRMEETARTLTAGMVSRLPILRESLPERYVPVDAFGKPLYPSRNAFLPDVTLRGNIGGIPDIVWPKSNKGKVEGITLPKFLTTTPMVNPPTLSQHDPYSRELRQLEDQVPELGATISPPTLPRFPETENMLRMGGRPVVPIDRDLRAAALRTKGASTELMLKKLLDTPAFQKLSPERKHFVVRQMVDMASSTANRTITPAMRNATMAPGARPQITAGLEQYIAQLENQMPR